jgi:hypothetical protein
MSLEFLLKKLLPHFHRFRPFFKAVSAISHTNSTNNIPFFIKPLFHHSLLLYQKLLHLWDSICSLQSLEKFTYMYFRDLGFIYSTYVLLSLIVWEI